jgi:hypothetical protein
MPTAKAKAPLEPAAPPSRQWFEDRPVESNLVFAGGQTPQARLRAKCQIYSYRVDDKKETPREKFFLVSLDGSTVHPGAMLFDRVDKRGYYTESVVVTMFFLNADELLVRQDQPQSSEEGGSISNSISLSFGVGFFGETPTGNAGLSIGNTISESLPDFEFLNDTRDATVRHTSRLRFVGGNGYRNAPDLIDPSSPISKLCGLPARAVSSMPLISQALFHAPNGISSAATLRIELTHRLMCIEKTFAPFEALHPNLDQVGYDPKRANQPQRVHVGATYLDIQPSATSYTWDVRVPFGLVQ